MGNSCTCFEHGSWDPEKEIKDDYPLREKEVHQDMTQPLPHYFISSGHNSYLTGDQLISASGTETIKESLEAGCRVIELDVYNGPVCKHGGTLTAPVDFHKCIVTMKEYGFTKSEYPVIITMEMHADAANQAEIAKILKDVLGEGLYEPATTDIGKEFQSPAALGKKFLIRSSPKKIVSEDLRMLLYIYNTKCTDLRAMAKQEICVSSSFEETALPKAPELGSDDEKETEDKEVRQKLLTDSKYRDSYDCGMLNNNPDDGSKVGTDPSLQELYTFTSRHLVRAYPSGWRVTSSNYNPMIAWIRGFSLAALNWQVRDKSLWCNEGMFTANGGCGYVLKPQWMRNPESKLPTGTVRTLNVHVYCAHHFQGSNCFIFKDDLYVKLTLWGMPWDKASQNTKTARDTGRLQVNQSYSFPVRFPEMAVLCVQLMDRDAGQSDRLGYRALPLAGLREGQYKLSLRNPATGKELEHKNTWVKLKLSWTDGAAASDGKGAAAGDAKGAAASDGKGAAAGDSKGAAAGDAKGTVSNPMYAGDRA